MIHDPFSGGCKTVDAQGCLIYICSRCGKCYVCKHKAIYFEIEDRWVWKCADGKLRPAINDGRLRP
jgi:hypothetical protein